MPSFSLLLWKHSIILKILPVSLFKVIVAAFKNPPVTVKLAPASENSSVNRSWHVYLGRLFPCPMRGDHAEKTDQWQRYCIVSRRTILMRLSVKVSKSVSVFIETKCAEIVIFVERVQSSLVVLRRGVRGKWGPSREYWMICRGPDFLQSYLPRPPLLFSRHQVVSLSKSSYVSPVELTGGREMGDRGGREARQIRRLREFLGSSINHSIHYVVWRLSNVALRYSNIIKVVKKSQNWG